MSLARARSAFNEFISSVNNNPWFYGGILFITFVGAVAAANQVNGIPIEDIEKLFNQKEGFIDGLSSDVLSNIASSYGMPEEGTVKWKCAKFNFYLDMCHRINDALCSPDQYLYSGVSEDKAIYFCNLVDVGKKVLSQGVLDTCAEMAEKATRTMGMG